VGSTPGRKIISIYLSEDLNPEVNSSKNLNGWADLSGATQIL